MRKFHKIYIVMDYQYGNVIKVFNVKHECVSWLEKEIDPAKYYMTIAINNKDVIENGINARVWLGNNSK